jgi:hypothetical protein
MLCPDEQSETGARVFAVFALRSLGEVGHGTNFIEHYVCRGTRLISGREFVTVQDVLNVHRRGRGICITNLSWEQGQKQKP